MHKTIYKEDNGVFFGMWQDDVSQIMYHETLEYIKKITDKYKSIADYGGGNGILKSICDCTVIDIDETKNPDIVANIINYKSSVYDLVVMRYVLHYLTDNEVIQLLSNITCDFVLVQFVNKERDIQIKYDICTKHESQKYFRTMEQLVRLLEGYDYDIVYKKKYIVVPSFYENRLGIKTNQKHKEEVLIFHVQNNKRI